MMLAPEAQLAYQLARSSVEGLQVARPPMKWIDATVYRSNYDNTDSFTDDHVSTMGRWSGFSVICLL